MSPGTIRPVDVGPRAGQGWPVTLPGRGGVLVALVLLLAATLVVPLVEPSALAVDPTPGPSPSASVDPAQSAAPTPSPDPSPDPSPADPIPAADPSVDPGSPDPTSDPTPAPATASPSPAPTASPTPAPAIGNPESPMSSHLSGDVYAYLPYWQMKTATVDYIDWNALSVLSLFSVTQASNGTLNRTLAGYRAITGSIGRTLIATAHARGVRVEITFTSFGLSKNRLFYTDTVRQATTIAELRAFVRAVGADGVNVDVESLEGERFDAYGLFIGRLRAALRQDNPRATVSVATNAAVSGARMARHAATNGVDRIFIMGYNYRGSGSSPGAIAPLDSRGAPRGLSLRWTLKTYAAEGVPLGRVLLGLPYSGMSWPTANATLGASRTGSGSVYFPFAHPDMPAAVGATLRYEPIESVSWFAYYDTAAATWRQVFYDTPRSLRPKYQLAIDRGLAGVGIWALGYDRGVGGYWDLLKTMFGPPRISAISVAPKVTNAGSTGVAVRATAGSRLVTQVRLGRDGKTWGAWLPLPSPIVDEAGQAVVPAISFSLPVTLRDGSNRVYAQVRDEGGTRSAAKYTTVVIDRSGPVLPADPALWYSSTSGSWRARWSPARDAHGVAFYSVWVTVNGGHWRLVAGRTTSTGLALPVTSRSARVTVIVRAVDTLGNVGPTRRTSR
jgi:spore germination protein YaaH